MVEAPYTGTQPDHIDSTCGFCMRDSVLGSVAVISDIDGVRKRWLHIHMNEKKRREEDLDYYEEYGRDRPIDRALLTRIEHVEREEMKMWMQYTCSVWVVNEQKIERFKLQLSRASSQADPKVSQVETVQAVKDNAVLKTFMQDLNERNMMRVRSGPSRRVRAQGMYCFEHGVVGDLVMHRRQTAYRECGVCVNTETLDHIKQSVEADTRSSSSRFMRPESTHDASRRGTKNKMPEGDS